MGQIINNGFLLLFCAIGVFLSWMYWTYNSKRRFSDRRRGATTTEFLLAIGAIIGFSSVYEVSVNGGAEWLRWIGLGALCICILIGLFHGARWIKGIKTIAAVGLITLYGCSEDPLPAHQVPIVSDGGARIEIVADAPVTFKQGKALINHYRSRLSNKSLDYSYTMDPVRGQVVLRVRTIDKVFGDVVFPTFMIFNEFDGKYQVFDLQ